MGKRILTTPPLPPLLYLSLWTLFLIIFLFVPLSLSLSRSLYLAPPTLSLSLLLSLLLCMASLPPGHLSPPFSPPPPSLSHPSLSAGYYSPSLSPTSPGPGSKETERCTCICLVYVLLFSIHAGTEYSSPYCCILLSPDLTAALSTAHSKDTPHTFPSSHPTPSPAQSLGYLIKHLREVSCVDI